MTPASRYLLMESQDSTESFKSLMVLATPPACPVAEGLVLASP